MAKAVRRSRVRRGALSEIKYDLSQFLHEAESEEIVITPDGNPADVLIGFRSGDDCFDYQLENDPRFFSRIEQAPRSLQEGQGDRGCRVRTSHRPAG